MEHIGNQVKAVNNKWNQEPPRKHEESPPSGIGVDLKIRYRTRRPLVIPRRNPWDIMNNYMTKHDIASFTAFMSVYERNKHGWDTYRKEIPPELLEKIEHVMQECRKEGYLGPVVIGSRLCWWQIMGRPNTISADECTTCPNSVINGSCNGKLYLYNEQMLFRPCWYKNKA